MLFEKWAKYRVLVLNLVLFETSKLMLNCGLLYQNLLKLTKQIILEANM